MKIVFGAESTCYKTKDAAKANFGRIRNRMKAVEAEPDLIIEMVKKGQSFTPAELTGTTSDTWKSQQIIAADVDNKEDVIDPATGKKVMDPVTHKVKTRPIANPATPEQVKEILSWHGLTPYVMYKSFSWQDSLPKFRVVIVLDEKLTDPKEMKAFSDVLNYIIENNPAKGEHKGATDRANLNEERIFFGSTEDCILSAEKNICSVETFRSLVNWKKRMEEAAENGENQAEDERDGENITRNEKKPKTGGFDLQREKANFNLLEYILATRPDYTVHKVGKTFYINPCPICGHTDDFSIDENCLYLFYCHSTSGQKGGSVIDYLMFTENLTSGEAIAKFQYDILKYPRPAEPIRATDAEAVTDQEEEPHEKPEIIGAPDYLQNAFEMDLAAFQKTRVYTGFPGIDKKLGGLSAGMYICGASSGTGKTSFFWQVADQIAASGKDVLFVSAEMSAVELITKSLSRIMAENGRSGNSSMEIRKYYRPSRNILDIPVFMNKVEVDLAKDRYAREIAPHMYIVEANFGITIEDIVEMVEEFTATHDGPPVLFIDYLQTVKTREKINDLRMMMDKVIIGFKLISRNYKTPVLVISSFNRSANDNEGEYNSFKESSMIEYSADCLLALQPAILKTKRKEIANQRTAAEREFVRKTLLEEAEQKNPREMHLVILKNRYGSKWHREAGEKKNYFDLVYYPDRDRFIEKVKD